MLGTPDGDEPLTAVIEMSRAAGRALLPRPRGDDPVRATTTGVGQLLLAARDAGARRIVIGCGGSATTDGGLGAYEAVGTPAALDGRRARRRLRRHDAVQRRRRRLRAAEGGHAGAGGGARPAPGRRGGPLPPGDRRRRHRRPGRGRRRRIGRRRSSRSGPASSPASTSWPGWSAWPTACEGADLAVTGEGHLDPPSFHGKVPGGVLELARARGAPQATPAGPVHRRRRRRVAAGLAAAGPGGREPDGPLRPGPGPERDRSR